MATLYYDRCESNKKKMTETIIEFDYNKIMKSNVAVHCDTEEKAINLLKWANSKGLTWCNGQSYINNYMWSSYGERTSYDLNEGRYGTFYVYKDNYSIYEYEDVIIKKGENKKMEKTSEKKELVKYEFKADEPNLDIIMNDAIRDNRRSFVVMGKTNALVGILHNSDIRTYYYNIMYKDGEFILDEENDTLLPFGFIIIDIDEVNDWIKELQKERKRYNKRILNMKDKIYKDFKKGKHGHTRFRVFEF